MILPDLESFKRAIMNRPPMIDNDSSIKVGRLKASTNPGSTFPEVYIPGFITKEVFTCSKISEGRYSFKMAETAKKQRMRIVTLLDFTIA